MSVRTFTSFSQADLPAAPTTLYTVPGATTTLVLSCLFSNITGSTVTVTVEVVRSGGTPVLSVITNGSIPAGGTMDVIINRPILLETGDVFRATASAGTSIDVTGSILEIA